MKSLWLLTHWHQLTLVLFIVDSSDALSPAQHQLLSMRGQNLKFISEKFETKYYFNFNSMFAHILRDYLTGTAVIEVPLCQCSNLVWYKEVLSLISLGIVDLNKHQSKKAQHQNKTQKSRAYAFLIHGLTQKDFGPLLLRLLVWRHRFMKHYIWYPHSWGRWCRLFTIGLYFTMPLFAIRQPLLNTHLGNDDILLH